MLVEPLALGDASWAEFVDAHPDATPFHVPAWSRLISDCYGFQPQVLAVRDASGGLLAGAPILTVRSPFGAKRWVSLPFSDTCPLLLGSDVDLGTVVDALRDYVLGETRIRELEIRSTLPAGPDIHSVHVGYHYTLELPDDPEGLHPHKTHRNTRNRALRKGVCVRTGSEAEDMEVYYRLHTLTRMRQGVPVQPKRFFKLIHEHIFKAGKGFVATAMLDGEAIASGVYLTHNRTIVAKFGASDPAHRDTGGGCVVDWEIMSQACREGFSFYDLGRSDLDAAGLRQYKSGWGAIETPLIYTHLGRTAPSAERPHVGGVSQGIIRRSPQWVCRGLGELLYRWSA